MADYFIESKNGEYPSWDGKRRFIKLSGKEAYEYLQTEEGRKKRFMKVDDDKGQISYFEIPADKVKEHRKDERRKQYVDDCREESGIVIVPITSALEDEQSEHCVTEESIADESVNVEEEAIHRIESDRLRRALMSLSDEEVLLILEAYRADVKATVRQLGKRHDVHFATISKRKIVTLHKLERMLKKVGYKSEKSVE